MHGNQTVFKAVGSKAPYKPLLALIGGGDSSSAGWAHHSPRQMCNMQGNHAMHKASACPWGGQRFASPKKVPGLTRPPSLRFAWAFSGLGRPASGMCASQLPVDELEADADEGGRECLPVVVTTARQPAAGGTPCVPFSPISADVPPAEVTTNVVATVAGAAGGGDCG